MRRLKVILLDKDRARAAGIADALSRHSFDIAVTIADNLTDVDQGRLERTVVLVADEGSAVAGIVERLKQFNPGARAIAFAEEPSSHQIVRALAAGAVDYLQWPCDAADIVAAADAATAMVG